MLCFCLGGFDYWCLTSITVDPMTERICFCAKICGAQYMHLQVSTVLKTPEIYVLDGLVLCCAGRKGGSWLPVRRFDYRFMCCMRYADISVQRLCFIAVKDIF